jgi:hypothetical protein
MTRSFAPLLFAVLACSVAGCTSALTTHDRSPSQLVAGCLISSNGSETVLDAALTAFGEDRPVVLHERDRALTHDATAERPLVAFAGSSEYSDGDTTSVTSYATRIPASVPPTLGFLLDNRPIQWASFTLPVAPTLKVDGQPRTLRWDPSDVGTVILYAACDEARPPVGSDEGPRPDSGESARIPIEAGVSSIEVTKLEAKLFGDESEHRTKQPDECRTIHVVASRSTSGPVALGTHASSSCSLEQIRAIAFDRTMPRLDEENHP